MTTYKITEVIDYKGDPVFKVYRERHYRPWFFGAIRTKWECLQHTCYGGGTWSADTVFNFKEEAQAAIDQLEERIKRPVGTVLSETIVTPAEAPVQP